MKKRDSGLPGKIAEGYGEFRRWRVGRVPVVLLVAGAAVLAVAAVALYFTTAGHPSQAARGIEEPEAAIRGKYLDEYRLRVGELERRWDRRELTAADYEQQRRALDAQYGRYLEAGAAASQPSGAQGFEVNGVFVSSRSPSLPGVTPANRVLSGSRTLYVYLSYRGADPVEGGYRLRWLTGEQVLREIPVRLRAGSGELVDSLQRVFAPGPYDVQLVLGERLLASTRFLVDEPLTPRIHAVTASPAEVVPGGIVSVTVEYSFPGADALQALPVQEQCVIERNGRTVAGPIVREVQRDDGLHTASFRIVIPPALPGGEYEASIVLGADGRQASAATAFTVLSAAVPRSVEQGSWQPDRQPATSRPETERGDVRLEDLGKLLERVYGK
ncbi:hypothetical protein CR163_008800 [Prosthecochloris sp. ZM_2]|uniref:hypothetical protein n=1 Tax=Prosthecochloris sp. ZM_2 TaxID=2045206 RepID=UPI000DF84CB1|nr:hypothetical protein [Prosthecochloris sp. ZM_2]RNA65310.1 hypothetical protein CR163_008800 [Prosthecochloris sp. ZM_2]